MLSYRIRNIKSFVDSGEIEVKPITIFVGRNSCGKSSLVRFPAVLAQTVIAEGDSPLRFYGNMVDYGNYEDVIHFGSSEKMSFELKYSIDVKNNKRNSQVDKLLQIIEGYEPDDRDLVLRVTLDKPGSFLSIESVELLDNDSCLFQIRRNGNKQYSFHVNYSYVNGKYILAPFYVKTKRTVCERFIPTFDTNEVIKNLYEDVCHEKMDSVKMAHYLKIFNSDSNKQNIKLSEQEAVFIDRWKQLFYYSDLMKQIYSLFASEAKNIRYIGPFRDDPNRTYRDQDYISYSVGVHGENTINELIRDYKRKDSPLINSISEWTRRVLGYEIIIREVTNGLFQVMLRDDNGIETNLIDNGYGISQVLPIVTQVVGLTTSIPVHKPASGKAERIVLLEQPELHLHPAAQSELADLFARCAIYSETPSKLLIETHSEHLIRKLQVLIASKDCELTSDMVAFYYVDKDENGEAHVEEMHILENGKFEDEWPSGFFDRGYQLSRELAKAGIRE